jgi:peptidoglycan/LPS O-acetylase OafA/YrhL
MVRRRGPLAGNLIAVANGCIELFAVVAVLGSGRRAQRLLGRLAPLGECSYGIYLWHVIVIFLVAATAAQLGLEPTLFSEQTIDWVVVALVTLPVATLSWKYVERPAMAWARGGGTSLRRTVSEPEAVALGGSEGRPAGAGVPSP